MPAVTICLPTYNERDNVEQMLHALAPLDVRVLVIDDNSPDGTGEIADRVAATLERVSVLHRSHKEGLGPAYIAGFRRALADGADYVISMDCDFSHDPADVPRLDRGLPRRAPTSRSAHATSPAAARGTGGSAAGSSRPADRSTRGRCSG